MKQDCAATAADAAVPWVVKLGGSLAASPYLPVWLAQLSRTAALIVPGGGPFADAVRQTQALWQFDEHTAHHMAIMAMAQYGRMLAGICPDLATFTTLLPVQKPGRARIWLPSPVDLDEASIPASWDVTSDSLAAWLAGQFRVRHLLLVKSATALGCAAETTTMSDSELVELGWVDAAFSSYVADGDFQAWLCGSEPPSDLVAALAEPGRFFIRMKLAATR